MAACTAEPKPHAGDVTNDALERCHAMAVESFRVVRMLLCVVAAVSWLHACDAVLFSTHSTLSWVLQIFCRVCISSTLIHGQHAALLPGV
jgi:hypothetical protein